MIEKPMLAAEFDKNQAVYPYYATPKVDGIRFIIQNGKALSRSLKPIRNNYVREILEKYLPEGCDGELTAGNFQETTSAIMTIEGQPDFVVWLFDIYSDAHPDLDYLNRIELLKNSYLLMHKQYRGHFPFKLSILVPKIVGNYEEVLELKSSFLEKGFEGIMLRSASGKYKFGRATQKQNTLLKYKDFIDDEAKVCGFEEKMHNTNEAKVNELGNTERSTSKEGLVPANTLGALYVEHPLGSFKIGTGFDDAARKEIWDNQDKYLGRLAKFKYMAYGVKELPRHPVFIGFRDEEDK